MQTIVLVHGAWGSSWSWDKVKPMLENAGYRVVTFDLPGHGTDKKPANTLTLDDFVDATVKVLKEQPEPVVLLGHSLGGTVISQAAEYCPEKISKLVYYSAFMLVDGEKQFDRIVSDKFTKVGPETLDIHEDGTCDLIKDKVRNVFFNTSTDEDAAFAIERLQTDSIVPMQKPLHLTAENYGRIPRYFIHCLQDSGITITTQRDMVKCSPCVKTFEIDADHFACFTYAKELFEAIDAIMKD